MADDVRLYDLPFGAPPPAVVNPDAGILRVVARGSKRSYRMDVTVLDAPDHRLVRAGVLLAHRVTDGVGEWYLAAPDWQPFLPVEAVEAVGEDLPTTFAQLVEPFRRGAAIGPVAGLECVRTEYTVRGEGNVAIAELRDERVTVSRSGLTTARYREVTVSPTEAATSEQVAWMDEAIVLAGGAQTPEFPSLVARLGAPATGLSDLPRRRRGHGEDTMETYVQALLSAHLHSLFAADLAVRAGAAEDLSGVFAALRRVRRDLRGLYPVFDATWLGSLLGDIDEVLERDVEESATTALTGGYTSVLDRLVQAVRAPRLGDASRRPAAETMKAELGAALTTLSSRCDALTTESEDLAWEQARANAENVAAIAAVARPLLGKKTRELYRRMDRIAEDLAWCAETSTVEPVEEIEAMDPVEAFRLGRGFERDVLVQSVARADFLDDWPQRARKLRRLVP